MALCLVAAGNFQRWVAPEAARKVASVWENDRARRPTHHLSVAIGVRDLRLNATAGQFPRQVVHAATDRRVVHALIGAVLGVDHPLPA